VLSLVLQEYLIFHQIKVFQMMNWSAPLLFAIFGARNKKILNLWWNLCGKTLEVSRRQITEGARGPSMWSQAAPPPCWPACGTHGSASPSYVGSPPPPRMHLRHSSSQFDPRAHVAPPAYISSPVPPSLEPSWNPNSYSLVRINWDGSHERINLLEPAIKRRLVLIRI
jgi:hypothetical protein